MSGDLDWLIAPMGRTRNGTPRVKKPLARALRVIHFMLPIKGTRYGHGTDPAVYRQSTRLDELTCRRCLTFLSWDGVVPEDDPRLVGVALRHMYRKGEKGFAIPIDGSDDDDAGLFRGQSNSTRRYSATKPNH